MTRNMTAVLALAACATLGAAAQDWYHDRDARYQGDNWRPQVFMHVKSDLDYIGNPRGVSEKEETRLARTREELSQMQADLDQGRFDNGKLNDVIDSLQKSANDERLSPQNRSVLSDDLVRLHDYQVNHNHWKRQ